MRSTILFLTSLVLAGSLHAQPVSLEFVQARFDGEESAAVLSDDTIVELLRADGVEIARRTVAKYREAMGIPSSVQRRRDKQRQI